MIITHPITQAVPFFISKLQNTFNSILYSIVHFPRIWLPSEHVEKRSILANNYTYVYNLSSLSVKVQCENPFHLFNFLLYRVSSPFFQLNFFFFNWILCSSSFNDLFSEVLEKLLPFLRTIPCSYHAILTAVLPASQTFHFPTSAA